MNRKELEIMAPAGNMNGIDAVVKILTEPTFPDQLLQIHIGGADKPDIDGLYRHKP